MFSNPYSYFLDGDKINILKIVWSQYFAKNSDGGKIPIDMFLDGDKIKHLKISCPNPYLIFLLGTRSPLTCILDRDKIKVLKIILSPCFVNISDGDMIPIEMFFEWGQDRTFENYLVPMLSKYF